jgi:Patched family
VHQSRNACSTSQQPDPTNRIHATCHQNDAVLLYTGGDIPLIAVAFSVIMTFTCASLFVKDTVYSKMTLAVVAIMTVALSIGAAFGLSLYMQIPFTSLSQVRYFSKLLCHVTLCNALVLLFHKCAAFRRASVTLLCALQAPIPRGARHFGLDTKQLLMHACFPVSACFV